MGTRPSKAIFRAAPFFEPGVAVAMGLVYVVGVRGHAEGWIRVFGWLEGHLLPKVVEFVSNLPKNANSKTDKAALRQQHR